MSRGLSAIAEFLVYSTTV